MAARGLNNEERNKIFALEKLCLDDLYKDISGWYAKGCNEIITKQFTQAVHCTSTVYIAVFTWPLALKAEIMTCSDLCSFILKKLLTNSIREVWSWIIYFGFLSVQCCYTIYDIYRIIFLKMKYGSIYAQKFWFCSINNISLPRHLYSCETLCNGTIYAL